MNRRNTFELLSICTAYEQGYGWGVDSREDNNPYPSSKNSGKLNKECRWAWQFGYAEGRRRVLSK